MSELTIWEFIDTVGPAHHLWCLDEGDEDTCTHTHVCEQRAAGFAFLQTEHIRPQCNQPETSANAELTLKYNF